MKMTDEQKKQIRLLRYQGLGYARIAKIVGITRDSVRGYCKRNELSGYAADFKENKHQSLMDEFAYEFCLHCGSKLEQTSRGRKRKFCGPKCKSEWEKTNRKIYILICEYCGKEYKSLGNKKRKYCTHDCYIRDRFWREEDAVQIVKKIMQREKVEHIPKWLKDLLLSSIQEKNF